MPLGNPLDKGGVSTPDRPVATRRKIPCASRPETGPGAGIPPNRAVATKVKEDGSPGRKTGGARPDQNCPRTPTLTTFLEKSSVSTEDDRMKKS